MHKLGLCLSFRKAGALVHRALRLRGIRTKSRFRQLSLNNLRLSNAGGWDGPAVVLDLFSQPREVGQWST